VKTFSQQLKVALTERQSQDLYRNRRSLESPQTTTIIMDGKKLLNFCSNDYLGLASHPEVIRACRNGLDKYGVGSGASHLLSGTVMPTMPLKKNWPLLPAAVGHCCFLPAIWPMSVP